MCLIQFALQCCWRARAEFIDVFFNDDLMMNSSAVIDRSRHSIRVSRRINDLTADAFHNGTDEMFMGWQQLSAYRPDKNFEFLLLDFSSYQ